MFNREILTEVAKIAAGVCAVYVAKEFERRNNTGIMVLYPDGREEPYKALRKKTEAEDSFMMDCYTSDIMDAYTEYKRSESWD